MNEAASPPCCAEWLRLSDGSLKYVEGCAFDALSRRSLDRGEVRIRKGKAIPHSKAAEPPRPGLFMNHAKQHSFPPDGRAVPSPMPSSYTPASD